MVSRAFCLAAQLSSAFSKGLPAQLSSAQQPFSPAQLAQLREKSLPAQLSSAIFFKICNSESSYEFRDLVNSKIIPHVCSMEIRLFLTAEYKLFTDISFHVSMFRLWRCRELRNDTFGLLSFCWKVVICPHRSRVSFFLNCVFFDFRCSDLERSFCIQQRRLLSAK